MPRASWSLEGAREKLLRSQMKSMNKNRSPFSRMEQSKSAKEKLLRNPRPLTQSGLSNTNKKGILA